MRRFFHHLSIQSKLLVIIISTSTILLLIVASSLLVAEYYSNRAFLTHQVKTLASSLAANSAQALVLDRYAGVEEMLAGLDRQNNIHAAYMFDQQGVPVAKYIKAQDPGFVLQSIRTDFRNFTTESVLITAEQRIMSWDHFSFFWPVSYRGEAVGSLYLLSDLGMFYARLRAVFFGVALSFLLLLLCAFYLARRLQRPISVPLQQLAKIMARVSVSRDYSLRAASGSQDEIGLLINGFNQMLERIEQQRDELAGHQRQLEKRVAEQTAELRLLVAELEQARERADSANEAKSDFLSKMTHELRTPLIGVLGMNELLQRTSLDERQLLLTETIQKSGEDLLALISDILDFSRIEAGKLLLEPKPVEIHRIIDECVHLLFPQARQKGLSLTVDVPAAALWTVRTDETRIRQILMNLVGNAIKFTASGSVSISLEYEQQTETTGLFSFSVADTGPGLTAGIQGRIFDAFYQADNSSTREQSGTGLGLAIVRQLVDLLGGELSLTTLPGKGSCFRVSIPLSLVEKTALGLPGRLREQPVLVCLEDESLAARLQKRLDELSLDVDRVGDGASALYRIRARQRSRRPYAFLFLDRQVKTMGQDTLCREIGADARFDASQLVLVGDAQDDGMSRRADVNCLALPLTWTHLREVFPAQQNLYVLPRPTESGRTAPVLALLGQKVASRELVRILLEKQGVDVVVAESLKALGNLPEAGRIAAILIDCPYSPWQDLQRFLQQTSADRPPVLLIADRNDGDICGPFSAQRILHRPLNQQRLGDAIRPFLQIPEHSRKIEEL